MAVLLGRFSGERILEAIEKSKLGERINHRRLITPGLVDVEVRGWKVIRGPISALELPLFLTFGHG
jgi:CO dehydrogenase/acetyl-CoA synthase gamma subunit (corrinoid Fe-S protein)